jgi:RHS repeat-associated protein
VTRPSDNQTRWEFNPNPFGDGVPNENPAALGVFKYHLRFPGQYFDIESNMAYNYFRDYDSAIGRYVESDPIGLEGGINTYSYVRSSPLLWVDPEGLDGLFPNRCYPGFHNEWSTQSGWTCVRNDTQRNMQCPSGACAAFPAESNCACMKECYERLVRERYVMRAIRAITRMGVVGAGISEPVVAMICSPQCSGKCDQVCKQ